MKCKYWSEEVTEICKLVRHLYDDMHEGAGGLLNIVLDDFNIDDNDLEWCITLCCETKYKDRHDRDICFEITL